MFGLGNPSRATSTCRSPLLCIGVATGLIVACGSEREEASGEGSPLLRPQSAGMTATAPDSFTVRFETSAGDFVVLARRHWAPRGVDRFYGLVRHGFYDGVRFFRVLEGFVAQFGIHGDPEISAVWRGATIADDPVVATNRRGTLSFATSGRDSRTTQIFINSRDNTELDRMGFAPFGEAVEGMEVVDALHSGYGEGAPAGPGPRQDRIQSEGNAYLQESFPELDYVRRAMIEARF